MALTARRPGESTGDGEHYGRSAGQPAGAAAAPAPRAQPGTTARRGGGGLRAQGLLRDDPEGGRRAGRSSPSARCTRSSRTRTTCSARSSCAAATSSWRCCGRPCATDLGTPTDQLHRVTDLEVGYFRTHARFGRLFLRYSSATMMAADRQVDEAISANYDESMRLQAGVFAAASRPASSATATRTCSPACSAASCRPTRRSTRRS